MTKSSRLVLFLAQLGIVNSAMPYSLQSFFLYPVGYKRCTGNQHLHILDIYLVILLLYDVVFTLFIFYFPMEKLNAGKQNRSVNCTKLKICNIEINCKLAEEKKLKWLGAEWKEMKLNWKVPPASDSSTIINTDNFVLYFGTKKHPWNVCRIFKFKSNSYVWPL